MKTTTKTLLTTAALTISLFSAANAQNISKGFDKYVGSSKAHARLYGTIDAGLNRYSKSASASARGGLSVGIFRARLSVEGGLRAKAVTGRTTGLAMQSYFRANGKVLGRNFGTSRTTNHGVKNSYRKNIGPIYPVPGGIRTVVFLGPVPVMLRGNVGIGAELALGIRSMNLRTMRFQPWGEGTGYGVGSVFAGIDMWRAGAGVEAQLNFGKLKVRCDVDGRPGLVKGRVRASITPVQLILRIKAWLGKRSWSKDLFNWSARSRYLGSKSFVAYR